MEKIAFDRPDGEGGATLSSYFSSLTSGKILLSSGVFSTSNSGVNWTKEPTDDKGYYKYYCDKPPSAEDKTHIKSFNSWNESESSACVRRKWAISGIQSD